MDYKKGYNNLINAIMEDIDNIPVDTVIKVKTIHDAVDKEQIEDTELISAQDWNNMSYTQKLELKQNDPAAYDAALQSQFK